MGKLIIGKQRPPDHPVNQPVIILRPKGMPLVAELEDRPADDDEEQDE